LGWLSGWGRRKSHVITGSTVGAQTNYQVRIIVHKTTGSDSGEDVYVGTNVRDDFGDVRFTKSDGTTLLDYFMEYLSSGVKAIFWVEVDSIPASPDTATVYVYYGKSDATTTSNIDNTFIFGDDFEDNSIDTNKWDYAGRSGTWTETGGQLHGNGAAGYMWNKIAIPANFRIKQKGKTSDAYVSMWALGAGSGNPYVSPWCAAYFTYQNLYTLYYDATAASEAQSFPLDTWYIQEFLVYGNSYTVKGYDSTHVPLSNPDFSVTATNKPTGNKISQRTYYYQDTEYIFVAKYVSPEPSHTSWGSEELPIITYYQSLPATEVSAATFIRNIGKSIAATESSAASLSRAAIFIKALSVIESSVAALTQVLTKTVSLIISEVSSATLSELATFFRSLSTTEISATSLSKIATFFRTLPAVESSITTLSQLGTYVRPLSVATAAVSNLFCVSTFLRALSVAEFSVASLAKRMFQSLSVTAISAATLSAAKFFTRALSAVSTSVAEIQKSITRTVLLAVTETVSLTMLRGSTFHRSLVAVGTSAASFFRGFFQSLAVTEVPIGTITKAGFYYITVAATAISSASIAKLKTILKTLGVTVASVVTLLATSLVVPLTRLLKIAQEIRSHLVGEEGRNFDVEEESRIVKA